MSINYGKHTFLKKALKYLGLLHLVKKLWYKLYNIKARFINHTYHQKTLPSLYERGIN